MPIYPQREMTRLSWSLKLLPIGRSNRRAVTCSDQDHSELSIRSEMRVYDAVKSKAQDVLYLRGGISKAVAALKKQSEIILAFVDRV